MDLTPSLRAAIGFERDEALFHGCSCDVVPVVASSNRPLNSISQRLISMVLKDVSRTRSVTPENEYIPKENENYSFNLCI